MESSSFIRYESEREVLGGRVKERFAFSLAAGEATPQTVLRCIEEFKEELCTVYGFNKLVLEESVPQVNIIHGTGVDDGTHYVSFSITFPIAIVVKVKKLEEFAQSAL